MAIELRIAVGYRGVIDWGGGTRELSVVLEMFCLGL
jgi:hypothetical protein